jgi:HK97 family phage portal protein
MVIADSTNPEFWGVQQSGLPSVTEQSAMTISAVFACVNLIAGAISALPMNIFSRKPDGEREQMHDDDIWWMLNEQFLPRWSAANGWEYLVQSVLFHGDAFAIIKRNGSRVVGLEPVHPSRVTVTFSQDGMALVYAVLRDGRVAKEGGTAFDVYHQDDMLHVAGFGFDGLRSTSPLRYHLRMASSVALATQDYAARFFSNSARPDMALVTDQVINQETATGIKESWNRAYQGTENSHSIAVLGAGVKLQQITMSAEDAQLLATRQFQIEEIARAYGVPPHMIGHTEKTTSWGAGVTEMGAGFVRFTLRQHLNKFQNEINRKFFRTASRFAEFDTFELERADMKSLFEGFRVALGRAGEPGFMSTDEVRLKLNLKRTPGGDTLTKGTTDAAQQTAQSATQ